MLETGEWPAPCARCEEAPERVVRVVEAGVGSRDEVERLNALEAEAEAAESAAPRRPVRRPG
jgi:hypothetical protein